MIPDFSDYIILLVFQSVYIPIHNMCLVHNYLVAAQETMSALVPHWGLPKDLNIDAASYAN